MRNGAKISAVLIATVLATVSLAAVLPSTTENSAGYTLYSEVNLEEFGITEKELVAAFEALGTNAISVYADEEGNLIAEAVDTIDTGRFGIDKVDNTHYRLYLDSVSVGLILGGAAALVGASIGTLLAPVVGTVIGGAIGSSIAVVIGVAINEGVDYSKGIVIDVTLVGAVIIFGVMLYPGVPVFTNVRSQ